MPLKWRTDKEKWHIYITEYYAEVKNNDILKYACKWIELDENILSEVTQTQENEHGMCSLLSEY